MLLIFDLDGVLVDFKEIHRNAFINTWNAIFPEHHIDVAFHAANLEALSTRQKIEVCSLAFDSTITEDKKQTCFARKQEASFAAIDAVTVPSNVREALRWAFNQGHTLVCCSNSIRATLISALIKLDVILLMSHIFSNEDVTIPKPNPEMYNLAVETASYTDKKDEVLVFEDSPIGITAAKKAGLTVIEVVDSHEITVQFIAGAIRNRCRPNYPAKKIRVVIPMAGAGSRFAEDGYSVPKPFIDVMGVPMYQRVLQNMTAIDPDLQSRIEYHLLVRKEFVSGIVQAPNLYVHTIDSLTEGAACTVLTIASLLNTDDPIIIANSDQWVDWEFDRYLHSLLHPCVDGSIVSFYQPDESDLKWSYARISTEGWVTEVQEKKFIGPDATVGIYGWKRGSDYVRQANAMIKANDRVKNEFYVCPVYNYAIKEKQSVRLFAVEKMWGLGVPADLNYFLANHQLLPHKVTI